MSEDMPKGAIAVTHDLDLCVELDEPSLLIERVRKIAESRAGEDFRGSEWAKIATRPTISRSSCRR